ncbi:toll/interleukin-1 receptor domain-containing protein [Sphingobacterium thalpophilum]|uniref:toll/interleukin-1 receptor domain-containing protein n=1 Tax=Sphingobacterium thalpophilum TaxID=259 RepID=UPI0031DF41DB
MNQSKKVFISYSWSSPQHEIWVLNLAEKLTHDGVHVILDKWDLTPGQDKYAFMEQMVHAVDIDKVLIILDQKYSEKANDRSGGVGTETLIISDKVYKSTTQEKFVPIVAERDVNGEAYLPTYLNSRIYIDLSSESGYEAAYEQLLRQIYERPSIARPKLGSPPHYIFSDSPTSFRTSAILRSFDSQIDRHPARLNPIARDFFDAFAIDLSQFSITDKYNNWVEFGKNLVENITKELPLRDDYIEFISKLTIYENEFDIDILINFLEDITSLLGPAENVSQWNSNDFSVYKFIVHEIWLYTIAVFLKRENYKFLEILLFSSYFSKERHKSKEAQSYSLFHHYLENEIKYYLKESTGTDHISPQAYLLLSRIPERVKTIELLNADLLCYYVSLISNSHWFPITYIYRRDRSENFPLFNKLVSKRHIDKVYRVFGQDNKDSLKDVLLKVSETRDRGYTNAFGYIPSIDNFVKLDQLGHYL